jgi:hypothetical protein
MEDIKQLMECKVEPRTWLGYVVDVATMGAYTTYRVNEYTECIKAVNVRKAQPGLTRSKEFLSSFYK